MRHWCLIAVLAVVSMPVGLMACPCVDTEVVRVDHDNRRLLATVSETSRVMVTAALWELLLATIQTEYPDWAGRWHVSFFTTAAAAVQAGEGLPDSHVADYERETMTLTLWPQLSEMRQEIKLEVR
jgi:hypothetical protein